MMQKLVLVRHGQSVWNLENKFTGWTDVPLSEKGIEEAKEAGRILKEKDFHFDIAFTSVLKRAEDTLDYILKEMGLALLAVLSVAGLLLFELALSPKARYPLTVTRVQQVQQVLRGEEVQQGEGVVRVPADGVHTGRPFVR